MVLAILFISFNYYINISYTNTMNNFYTEFSSGNFNEAKKTLSANKIINIIKKNSKTSDLNKYFTSVVNILCKNLKNNSITNSQALVYLNEINSYNILNSSINKLIISLDKNYVVQTESDYKAILLLGVDSYNNGNLKEGIDYLKKIPSTSKYASKANKYIKQYVNEYK